MNMKHAMIVAIGTSLLLSAGPAAAQEEAATPEARRGMAAFATCVAAASPEKTAATLAMNFTERPYRAALRTLATTNARCLKMRNTTMRSTGLPFAGALAEAMLRASGAPLCSVLARGATVPAPASFSATDAAAMCAVRSVPDDISTLIASDVASTDEQALLGRIKPVYAQCAGDTRIEASDTALRAMLATAAFRVARNVSSVEVESGS